MNAQAKEIAVKTETTAIATPGTAPRFTPEQIAASEIKSIDDLPDTSKMEKHFMPLNEEYWSPKNKGEERIVYIFGIENRIVPEYNSIADADGVKPTVTIPCVLMVEKRGDLLVRVICGSKMLVSYVRSAIASGEIVPASNLSPVAIKYLDTKLLGKGQAALWQIIPLIVAEQ